MKRILALALALCQAAVLLAVCAGGSGSSPATNGKLLKVGVRKNLACFSSYSEEADDYYGFEDDLAEAVAREMGYSGAELVGLNPEDRESALESGEVDCLIAAFSYTEERAEKFDLTAPYYRDAGRILIECSTLFEDLRDLKGAAVAVREGTTARENLSARLQEEGLIRSDAELERFLKIVEFASYEEMEAALETGEVDALCADGCVTLPWMNEERTYLGEAYSEENYVIASAKGSALGAKLSSALSAVEEKGTLTELAVKWGVSNEEE